jgi:hypothetical protein
VSLILSKKPDTPIEQELVKNCLNGPKKPAFIGPSVTGIPACQHLIKNSLENQYLDPF